MAITIYNGSGNAVDDAWAAEIEKVPVPELNQDRKPTPGVSLKANVYGPTPLFPWPPFAVSSGAETRRFAEAAMHPLVQAALNWRLRGAFQRGFELVPGNSKESYEKHPGWEVFDREIMDMIRDQVDNFPDLMGQTLKQTLESVHYNGMVHGFNVAEGIMGKRWGINVLRGVLIPSPELFMLNIDESNLLCGLQYTSDGISRQPEDMTYIAVTPYPRLQNLNYYGQSLIQPILRSLRLLQGVEEKGLRALSALAMKDVIIEYDINDKKRLDIMTLASGIRNGQAGSVITVPSLERDPDGKALLSSFVIKVLDSRAEPEAISLILQYLEYYPKEINRAFGMPDDIGMTTVDGGAYAKSANENVTVIDPVHAQDRDFIRGFMNNTIIPWMVKPNYLGPNGISILPPGYQLPRYGKDDEFDAVDLVNMSDTDRESEMLVDSE